MLPVDGFAIRVSSRLVSYLVSQWVCLLGKGIKATMLVWLVQGTGGTQNGGGQTQSMRRW
jgi:hypothetical protein